MTISSRTIAKNTGVLMVSQVITWGLTFLVSIIQPRYLGPAGMGQLQLAISLWAIVGVIAALGTDLLITKEVARSTVQLNELVGTTLALRAFIFLAGTIVMALYLLLVNYSTLTVLVIWIVGIASFIAQLSGTFEATLKGLERMEYTALAAVTSFTLQAVLIIGLLLLGYGVAVIAAVSILTSAVTLAVQYRFLRKLRAIRLSMNWRAMVPVLKASLPFFLVTVGIVLYHQVDTVIISLLVDEATVGWYGVANRLYGSLLFIPNVFVTALFPALSRAHQDDPAASRKLAQKSLNLLVLVSVPVGWGMMVIANQLVVLLFGDSFANSGPVLAVRGCFLFLTFVNMLLGFLLISIDRQKAWASVILIATFVTIPLDLVLIPLTVRAFSNGALGGAFSFAFTEIAMTAAGLSLLPSGYFQRSNWNCVARLILAGLAMVGAAWIWRDAFLLIPIAVGAVTYVGLVFLLRAIPEEDRKFIAATLWSILQRIRARLSRAGQMEGGQHVP